MTEVADIHEHGKQDAEHGHTITVTIDGAPKNILQARYLVAELKTQLGVPSDYELDQVVDGEFKPLNDTDHINIKEGEVFVSHVRRGSAS